MEGQLENSIPLQQIQYAGGINIEWWKKINIKPCGMYEWFDCYLPGCGGFAEYFSTARPRTTLPFLHHKIVDKNASLEAELLDLTLIS